MAFLAGALGTLVIVDRLLRFDSQAVATAVTLAATIATTAATVALAWYGWVQMSEPRRQQRGIAAMLLVEVRRIRSELGQPLKGGLTLKSAANVIVVNALPPEIHPWFPPVIPQIAEASADIVRLFLELDRDLHNYRVDMPRLDKAERQVNEEEETLAKWTRSNAGAVPMNGVMQRKEIEARIKDAQQNMVLTAQGATASYKGCHETLDALEKALKAVLT
ncbi:MAG TPA: hypothetical protein VNH14_10055 [Gemmatimonadales bacterium]|nr:hypothetical protein [Gemmatimonadales bacterium]